MKITLSELSRLADPVAATIHSLDLALYQVTVEVEGSERLVAYDDGKPFRERSLQRTREMLAEMPVASVTLRHESAYDEMIGQDVREDSNALEVNLKPLDPPDRVVH